MIEAGKAASRVEPVRHQELDVRRQRSFSDELADRITELATRVDVLLLLDQVELPETGVATKRVTEAAHAALTRHKAPARAGRQPPRLTAFPAARLQDECRRARPDDASTAIDLEAVKSHAADLARATGQPVFVTLAECGIVGALPGERPEHVQAHPVRGPIDVVGAGDAVTANLAAALAAGADAREAMELAMAAASLVIHQIGTRARLRFRRSLDCYRKAWMGSD